MDLRWDCDAFRDRKHWEWTLDIQQNSFSELLSVDHHGQGLKVTRVVASQILSLAVISVNFTSYIGRQCPKHKLINLKRWASEKMKVTGEFRNPSATVAGIAKDSVSSPDRHDRVTPRWACLACSSHALQPSCQNSVRIQADSPQLETEHVWHEYCTRPEQIVPPALFHCPQNLWAATWVSLQD